MADTLPHSDKKETSSAKAITFQLPTAEYAALAKKGKENHRRNLQENNTEFPAIDWGYLAWLWNTTIQVWPDIRDSTEAEQQYYQSKRANAPSYFGQLCRTYGPVLPQLAPSISKKGFWVRRYREVYEVRMGSDDELLDQMAGAYLKIKLDLIEADEAAFKRQNSMNSQPTSSESKEADYQNAYDDDGDEGDEFLYEDVGEQFSYGRGYGGWD